MGKPMFVNNVKILKHILKAKGNLKSHLLTHTSSSVIKSIGEIALNILKGTIPLSDKEKEKLRVWKNDIKKLGLKKTSLKEKRDIVVNNKKVLPLILKPLFDIIENGLQ